MGRARLELMLETGNAYTFFLKKCKHTPSCLNKLSLLENVVKTRIGSTCYLVSGQQSVHTSCHTHCVLLLLTNWVINFEQNDINKTAGGKRSISL